MSAASNKTPSVGSNTKKRLRDKADEVLNKVKAKLDMQEDSFDIVGKNVASKLRNLPPDAALMADKLISDILFEAALGNITKQTKMSLTNNDNHQHWQSAPHSQMTLGYAGVSHHNEVDVSQTTCASAFYSGFATDIQNLP